MHGLFNGVLCHSSIRLAASWFAHSLVRSPSCEQSSWRHSLKREIEGQEGAFPRTTELEKPPSSLFEFLRLGLPLAESLRRHRA